MKRTVRKNFDPSLGEIDELFIMSRACNEMEFRDGEFMAFGRIKILARVKDVFNESIISDSDL